MFPGVARLNAQKIKNLKLVNMNKLNLASCVPALALGVGLFAAAFPAAGQSILININQDNISAVTFTATVNDSFAASSVNNFFGVDLISYFTSPPAAVAGTTTGTLIPTGTATAYDSWFPDNLNNGTTNVDLNMYVTTTSQTQAFSTSSPAFTGTAVINLSALLADLPVTGTHGNIYSGDIRSPGVLIGTWTVVPEPSSVALLALGSFAGLILVRRKRN